MMAWLGYGISTILPIGKNPVKDYSAMTTITLGFVGGVAAIAGMTCIGVKRGEYTTPEEF